jgi:hypothetical protein
VVRPLRQGRPSASRRLLTKRWLHDEPEAAVDRGGDGNVFSRHYLSRLDISDVGGERVRCEDLRDGCTALVDSDGGKPGYDVIAIATSPDR